MHSVGGFARIFISHENIHATRVVNIRELKQRLTTAMQRTTPSKNEFGSVQYANGSENVIRLNMH